MRRMGRREGGRGRGGRWCALIWLRDVYKPCIDGVEKKASCISVYE